MDPTPDPDADAQDSAVRRLFVGWMADAGTREALAALQEMLRPRLPARGLRWVAPADLHLTLRFIGATPASLEDRVASVLAGLAARQPPIAARTGALRWWPSAAAPRVLVLRVDSHGALERCAASLESALQGAGLAAEPRRFRAHLTLARAIGLRTPVVDGGASAPHLALPVARLSLVDSAPRGDGTRYRERAGWVLSGH